MKKEQFQSKYGHFSSDGKEYVITRPDTPTPWVNVVANEDYGFVLSQAGSGFSWKYNSNLARVTRWYQDLIRDNWGKYLYIRDNSNDEFWSLTWKPTCPSFDEYEVRHGIGYTKMVNEYKGVKADMLIFVPPEEPLEIWKVTLKNNSEEKKELSLFSYFEWCLGNGNDTHREFQRTFVETSYNEELNTVFGKKREVPVPGIISTGLPEWPLEGFHSVNQDSEEYEGSKEGFLGKYGDLDSPKALEENSLTGTVGKFYDSIGSLKTTIELDPGEEETIIFTLGSAPKEEASDLVEKYHDPKEVNQAFQETKDFWEDLLSGFSVETPDPAFDLMINNWLKYQAISSRLWARCAYYQSSGGYGFRDQLQDSLLLLPLKPELTRDQILFHAEHQFEDGTVYHWFHALTGEGAPSEMTDDLLWLAFLTSAYLKETDDYSILEEEIPFVDGPKASLYEHCLRAIDKGLSRFSSRGLPLIGEGDWNDGMSSVGAKWEGESIWLGHFLYRILREFAPICEGKNDSEKAEEYEKRAKELKEAINEHGWDGSWYIRATTDDGELVGSSQCGEGKIFLNAQTWSVINEVAPEDRAKEAMKSAEDELLREYGPILFYPGYTEPRESIGYLSRYAAGMRENAGVYTHAAAWMILAECKLKQGNKAHDIFTRLCPPRRGMEPDEYYAEPYVVPGNTDGPQSAFFGRGGWTWYTGSAAWLFRVGEEWILGIRPQEDGLLIDPCIPEDWDGFKVKRDFRGATYEIEVDNSEGVSHGVKKVVLDGETLSDPVLPVLDDEKTHEVKVEMGT